MKHTSIPWTAAVLLIATQAAQAQEAFKTYDSFSGSTINSALWSTGERSIGISRGVLNITNAPLARPRRTPA